MLVPRQRAGQTLFFAKINLSFFLDVSQWRRAYIYTHTHIYKCIKGWKKVSSSRYETEERERERERLGAAFQRGNTVDTVHSFRTEEGEGNRILGRLPAPPILRRRRRQAAAGELAGHPFGRRLYSSRAIRRLGCSVVRLRREMRTVAGRWGVGRQWIRGPPPTG